MEKEELNSILKVLNNRVSIYLRGEQAKLDALFEQYGTDYSGEETTSLLSKIKNVKKYNMELLEMGEMLDKLSIPTKDNLTNLFPAIVSLFNDIKNFKSDAKIGNVLVIPTDEELSDLEIALKKFLSSVKSKVNESGNISEVNNDIDSKPLSNLEIFRAKRRKYDEDSYFTRAIAKLRYIASKEVGGSSNAR